MALYILTPSREHSPGLGGHVAGVPQVLSSLHVIWGNFSYPGTGAHLVVGVDLVQILHSEVWWAGALGSLFCDHSLGDRRVGGGGNWRMLPRVDA